MGIGLRVEKMFPSVALSRADKGILDFLREREPWRRMRELNQLKRPSQLTFLGVCYTVCFPKVKVPKIEIKAHHIIL